jgi:uncharacterized protein YndB with AHSA1/START domain
VTVDEFRADEDGLAISRTFDAPREAVWEEWTQPEAFADWYGGPEAEIPLDTVTMDVQEGGAWGLTMLFGPGRREIRWEGTYREVVKPERLVFTITDRPGEETFELVTVVLHDLGDGRTQMHFHQGRGMSPAAYERAGRGWTGFFDEIAARLKSG